MERFKINNTNTDPFIKNIEDTNPAKFGHINAIVDQINNTISGAYTPTITDEVNGTLTIYNFIIDKVGNIVTFSFTGRFDLARATSGGCKIDLPLAFQPLANWGSQFDVNAVLHRVNGIFTAECKIFANDSGTKLLNVTVSDTTAEVSIRFTAIGHYKIA